MYQQYRILNNEITHICSSARSDEINSKILRGDFLDKTNIKTEEDIDIPFTIPTRDEMMTYIFNSWMIGDILYIGDSVLINPILDKGELREKTREELIINDNRLELLNDGEYIENDKLIKVEYDDSLEFFEIVWNRELKQWVEGMSKIDQLDYLKQEILKNSRELVIYKESGFSNDELQNKINILVERHKIISEELATSIK